MEVNQGLATRLATELGITTHGGSISDAQLPEDTFDAVTFWWVLEHTHDPVGSLRAAYRCLKPGGVVVVALQNFASLGRTLFGKYWHHLDIPCHLYHFEPGTLRAILDHVGFEPFRIRHDLIAKDLAPSLGYALKLRQSLDTLPLNVLALPFDLLAWGLRRSGLITAYARKP